MRTAEHRALGFAEDLGRLLGTAEKKANEWLQQRGEVTRQLTELRDRATQLLERLGGTDGVRRGRRAAGRPAAATGDTATAGAGRGQAKGARKRKGMTAAQRKAVGERMRRYWAQRRKAESK
jgi:hypothetical protein